MKNADFPEFVWIWNRGQGLVTPKLHVRIARWLAARWQAGDRELLLMAFRNSGKSTLVGLFCAWLLMRDPNTRILVLAADFALAGKMTRNVKKIIERHPLAKGLKPKRASQWAAGQFTVNRESELRDPSMLAKGAGANITGSRADVVICDDVEVPNTCDTAPKRADLRERLLEIEYVLVPGGLRLFAGTPHSYYSIYKDGPGQDGEDEAPFLAGFKRLELALLNEQGESRWPERFPVEKIESMRKSAGPNKFESQMMLRPQNIAEGRLDVDCLRYYDAELVYSEGNGEAILTLGGKRLVSASCWWDPSFGAPEKGDASVIAALFGGEDGEYWLHRVLYMKHDPGKAAKAAEATQLCRQAAAFVNEFYLPAITLETNGVGRFLPGLLRRELTEAGQNCAVIEASAKKAKGARIIEAFDAILADRRLHAHRSVWDTPFISEMREWRPGGKGPDDGLDAVSGCLLSVPVRLPRRPQAAAKEAKARRNWRPGAGAFQAAADFKI